MAKQSSPIFLLGMQRSGTSLVRAFLANHPEIAIPIRGETQFFAEWYKEVNSLNTMMEFQKFHQRFLVESTVSQWEIDWKSFSFQLKDEGVKSKQYFDALMSYYAMQQGKLRWGEKSTAHIECIEQLLELYPEARYLVVVRDPRDTFCSACSVKWNREELLCPRQYAQQWASVYTRALGTLIRSRANWRVVRHESVVAKTKHVIEDIFSWLDEPFSEELLSPQHLDWEQNSSFGDQKWTDANYKQYTSELKIDSSTVGRWKYILSPEETFNIEEGAYHGLLTFGYKLSSELTPVQPKPRWKNGLRRIKATVLEALN
ncbi:MAG: sulfotransferase [Cyanobacteria bacterium J06555_13]